MMKMWRPSSGANDKQNDKGMPPPPPPSLFHPQIN
jgi:hypothetical protein